MAEKGTFLAFRLRLYKMAACQESQSYPKQQKHHSSSPMLPVGLRYLHRKLRQAKLHVICGFFDPVLSDSSACSQIARAEQRTREIKSLEERPAWLTCNWATVGNAGVVGV